MIVVSDTSCLSNLFLIGEARLLSLIYGTVIVPPAVWKEFLELEAFGFTPADVTQHLDLKIVKPQNQALVEILNEQLDTGESQAIALAKEVSAQLLLIDERHGTAIARSMGLKTTGILGILLEAKSQKLIPEIKPLMDDLRSKAGFWMTDFLEKQILAEAGEYRQ
jgi:uncharacterized protein